MVIYKRLAAIGIGLLMFSGCGGADIKTETHYIDKTTGTTDKIVVRETNPQQLYQETVQKMMAAMEHQKPTLEIRFQKGSSDANYYQSIESLNRAVSNDFDDLAQLLRPQKSENYDISGIRNAVQRLRSSALPAITTAFFTGTAQGGKNSLLPIIRQRQRIDWRAVLALIERTPTTGENWKNGLIEGLKNLGIPLAIAGMATVSVQAARTSELIAPDNTNIAGGDQSQGESLIDKSTKTTESFNTPTEESFNTTTLPPTN